MPVSRDGVCLGFGHSFAFSRPHAPEVLCGIRVPRVTEGAGKAGRAATPQPRVGMKKPHELVTTGTAAFAGLPCAMVYDFLRALPGVHDLLVTVACGLLRDLAPAKGRQDHTPSPSATCRARRTRCRVHRIPSRVRGDRDPPLIGMECSDHRFDLGFQSTEFPKIGTAADWHDGQFAQNTHAQSLGCLPLACRANQ